MRHIKTQTINLMVDFEADDGSKIPIAGDFLRVAMAATRGGRSQLARLRILWEPGMGDLLGAERPFPEILGVAGQCSVPEFQIQSIGERLEATMYVLPDGLVTSKESHNHTTPP